MISSTLQEVLMPVSFGSLFCLMLLYWGQAALFSYTKYSKFTTVLFSFSFLSLTTLLILRWVDSGHFPLSNLYESLLFLSWSFLGIQLVAQLTLISAMPEPALLLTPTEQVLAPFLLSQRLSTAQQDFRSACGESDRPHSAELPELRSGWPQRGLSLARPTRFSLFNFFEAKPDFALREVSQRQLLHLLGVITSPMALLTYGFAFLNLPREMQKATALVPALQSNWLMMHVTIMILSYAALLCGSIFSMVFLLLTNLNTASPLLQTVSKPSTRAEGNALGLEFADVPNGNARTDRAGDRFVGQLSRPPARSLFSAATRAHFATLVLSFAEQLLRKVRERSRAIASQLPERSSGNPEWPTGTLAGLARYASTRPALAPKGLVQRSKVWPQRGLEHEQTKGEPITQDEDYLKVELQLAALPHKELPKLCFSDRLELHDWARRAHTRVGCADGRVLGVAKQPKSKASFAQSGSALSQQDLALLNSKAQFAGDALTGLWAGIEPKQNLEKAERIEPATTSIGPKGLETPYLSLAERLDNYSYRVLALGFPLLTVGILSGAVWANEAWGSYWSWDPKETWALITWLVFAIYLHARILKGWTGQKPAIIATFGFFVVWFCYLGVNLLGTGLHSYGWFSN